jgi:hypothetical protein
VVEGWACVTLARLLRAWICLNTSDSSISVYSWQQGRGTWTRVRRRVEVVKLI